MLQCQVSNQLSSLNINDNGSAAFPMYVSTRDLKLGLTTFWRSPYGTGSRKREFPTVKPAKSWNDDTHLPMPGSTTDSKVRGILKNGAVVDSSSDDSDPSRKKFKKTLRRASSFTAPNLYSSQTPKKVQFDEENCEDVPQVSVVDKSEISISQCSLNPTDSSLLDLKNSPSIPTSSVSVSNKSLSLPNVSESVSTPRPVSAVAALDSSPTRPASSSGSKTPSRIPRLCRSYSTLPERNSVAVENSSNGKYVRREISAVYNPNRKSLQRELAVVDSSSYGKTVYRETPGRSTPGNRPRTWGGVRSAVIPDHTNFCNREKTIRILKWLQDVDDKQTREGRCTELMNSVELSVRSDS